MRDLNKILLKEPFYQHAETADGQHTRKRIVPGQYKTQPNHVRTATGELHRFAEPEETPALMETWTRDFRRDLSRSAYPLPLFLAESHWSFVRIHPFDDGNGRTARLITNYVLLRQNLPPMVIKSDHRDRYIGALQHADLLGQEPAACPVHVGERRVVARRGGPGCQGGIGSGTGGPGERTSQSRLVTPHVSIPVIPTAPRTQTPPAA